MHNTPGEAPSLDWPSGCNAGAQVILVAERLVPAQRMAVASNAPQSGCEGGLWGPWLSTLHAFMRSESEAREWSIPALVCVRT